MLVIGLTLLEKEEGEDLYLMQEDVATDTGTGGSAAQSTITHVEE